ncbi:hypothetical protein LJC07_07315 [Christensenellaceae bacterium OttesenSCG-928-L17]|nr:hypothetical protein [Christensenellaceae bacterium OttesenSCG-928-L17]
MSFNFNWSAVSGGAPFVTLSSLGISFNSVSIEKLGNPEKIMVGFDEEQCVIGVKAYNNEAGIKPYEFAGRVKNGWVRIGCREFIRYLHALSGIEFYPSKKYIAKFDAGTDTLIVEIRGEFENHLGEE